MKMAVGFHGRTRIVIHKVTSKAIVGRDGINDILDIIFILIIIGRRRRSQKRRRVSCRRVNVSNGRWIFFVVRVVVVVERKDSNDHGRTRPRSWR